MLNHKRCYIIILKKFFSILCISLSMFYILFNSNIAYADDDNIKSYVENIFLPELFIDIVNSTKVSDFCTISYFFS